MLGNIFNIIWLVGFIAGSVIRGVYTHNDRKREIITDNESGVDIVLVVLAGIGGFVLPLVYVFSGWLGFADYETPNLIGWLGAAVFAGGLFVLWRSHKDLGGNWSAKIEVKKEHVLVTKGIYKYIRHPMYAAFFLMGIGQGLLLGNWIAGPGFIVFFVLLYFVRVPREEEMMVEQFGEEYETYIKRTGRIIPRFSGS